MYDAYIKNVYCCNVHTNEYIVKRNILSIYTVHSLNDTIVSFLYVTNGFEFEWKIMYEKLSH